MRKDGKPKKGARGIGGAAASIAAAARSMLVAATGPGPDPDAPPPGAPPAADVLDRLWATIETRRTSGDIEASHSARLLARGPAKVAQKLGEEAVECVIEAALGRREATILESADLLYHLTLVWVGAGIRPEEVWAELVRREGMSGIAEKAARPRNGVRTAETRKLP